MAAPSELLAQPARNVAERFSFTLQVAWKDLSECTSEISRSSARAQPASQPEIDSIALTRTFSFRSFPGQEDSSP